MRATKGPEGNSGVGMAGLLAIATRVVFVYMVMLVM